MELANAFGGAELRLGGDVPDKQAPFFLGRAGQGCAAESGVADISEAFSGPEEERFVLLEAFEEDDAAVCGDESHDPPGDVCEKLVNVKDIADAPPEIVEDG